MRVLVTGAQGFLGSAIVSTLVEDGFDVVALSRKNCDLTSLEQTKSVISKSNVDLVIHCAAFVPKSSEQYENDNLTKVNAQLLENVLKSTSCPIVYISSMTVYGGNNHSLKSESEVPAPESAYARSKYHGELYLKNSMRDSLSIRIPGLFGIGRESGLIFNNLKKASEGSALSLPEKPLLWASMDVNDAAKGVVKAIKKYRFSGFDIINLGYSESYSINKLVDIYIKIFGKKINYDVNHPNFEFDLSKLKKLDAIPENDLFNAIKNLKEHYAKQ